MEEAPFENSPVDMLFVLMSFFVLMTVLQMAPLTQWFSRQQGARFGLTVGRRAALALGTSLVGLAVVLVLLNEALALVFSGTGWPGGAEWAFEGMDVVGAVAALVSAGSLGAVILGVRGPRRWFGAGLGLVLLGVLGASAVEPLWAGSALWAMAAAVGHAPAGLWSRPTLAARTGTADPRRAVQRPRPGRGHAVVGGAGQGLVRRVEGRRCGREAPAGGAGSRRRAEALPHDPSACWNARARNRKSMMLPSCGCSQLS